ncbi:MAG: hypothetical protein ACFCVA_09060 [Gammaproteobacteria bacterium]
MRNLFADKPHVECGEHFEAWLRCKNVVIERIVSSDRPDLLDKKPVMGPRGHGPPGHEVIGIAGKVSQ